jgi:hypothetical protein
MGPSRTHRRAFYAFFSLWAITRAPLICIRPAAAAILFIYLFMLTPRPNGKFSHNIFTSVARLGRPHMNTYMQFTIALFSKGPPVIYARGLFSLSIVQPAMKLKLLRAQMCIIYIYFKRRGSRAETFTPHGTFLFTEVIYLLIKLSCAHIPSSTHGN